MSWEVCARLESVACQATRKYYSYMIGRTGETPTPQYSVVHADTNTHMHNDTKIHARACTRVRMHTPHVRMHTREHARTQTNRQTYRGSHARTNARTHACTRAHMHTYTNIHDGNAHIWQYDSKNGNNYVFVDIALSHDVSLCLIATLVPVPVYRQGTLPQCK